MDYVWNDNYPIAIHITSGEYTPEQLQTIANHEQLVVRDMRAVVVSRDYNPESL